MGKDKKDEREIRRELLYLRDSDSRPLKRGKMVREKEGCAEGKKMKID